MHGVYTPRLEQNKLGIISSVSSFDFSRSTNFPLETHIPQMTQTEIQLKFSVKTAPSDSLEPYEQTPVQMWILKKTLAREFLLGASYKEVEYSSSALSISSTIVVPHVVSDSSEGAGIRRACPVYGSSPQKREPYFYRVPTQVKV